MALNAYLKIVAETQGPVPGSVTQKGREGTILVHAAVHEIVGPRDPASGRPTGKRVHKPFVITKPVDRASPILYSILCNNENIRTAELFFFTPDKMGVERQHYTVRLENANICSINLRLPNTRHKFGQQLVEREEVGLTYQKIIWTWNEGGITAEDDWETPR
jgi:type VI secretion system secreted protein Hcp